ncbi:hypothetical protein [Beijerinckia sp. L45]|uniref:hypothetical protein n=1 Tax=Beijerinckia sp. L45 TaxID=1641855 RepID=UPI00131E4B2E|nr:hypothetical protein [Beijerinckia sp. L45]
MQIEEIVRSCVHEAIAQVAVQCIGRKFYAEIEDAATTYGMTPGAFTALSVERFARHGDEAEIRAVRTAMIGAQEPILAGLHRILCIMLAVGVQSDGSRQRERAPRLLAADIDHLDIAARCNCGF